MATIIFKKLLFVNYTSFTTAAVLFLQDNLRFRLILLFIQVHKYKGKLCTYKGIRTLAYYYSTVYKCAYVSTLSIGLSLVKCGMIVRQVSQTATYNLITVADNNISLISVAASVFS